MNSHECSRRSCVLYGTAMLTHTNKYQNLSRNFNTHLLYYLFVCALFLFIQQFLITSSSVVSPLT